MRSLLLILTVLMSVSVIGCFVPAYHGDPHRMYMDQLPIPDDDQLSFDAQVIKKLNKEQDKQAALRRHSDSETNRAAAEKISGQFAAEAGAQSARQSPVTTLEQKQLEQTDRIIDLMEKIDDDDVRRILAEKIAINDTLGKAAEADSWKKTAAKSQATNAPAVQLASFAKIESGFDEEFGSENFNPANDTQPRRLDESGLPIESDLASTGSASAASTVANINPTTADAVPGKDRVEIETGTPIQPGSWKQELQSTISSLEKSLYQHDLENSDQATLQIYLRLLHLIANDKEQATRAIPELDDHCDQRFWQCQMAALATLLDSGPANSESATFQNSQRVSTDRTLEHLRQAIGQLSYEANLQIENVALCREVNGYGQFETFKTNEFLPKQQVLIYCELENFVSLTVSSGKETKYETELKGSFTILNEQNQPVYQHEYSAVRDIGQRRRRDFYMYFPMTIPQLPSGSYSLQLEIEDLKGNKAGTLEKPLAFDIR